MAIILGTPTNETLPSTDQSDTYVLDIGSGKDIIQEQYVDYYFGVPFVGGPNHEVPENTLLIHANLADVTLQPFVVGSLDNPLDSTYHLMIHYGPNDKVAIIQQFNHYIDATQFAIKTLQLNDAVIDLTKGLTVSLEKEGWESELPYSDLYTNSVVTHYYGEGYLFGTAFNDTFIGSNGDNHLDGGSGNDLFMAKGGHDIIYAGVGDDTINGGIGNDALYGEKGSDSYTFTIGDGTDTIIEQPSEQGTSENCIIIDTDVNSVRLQKSTVDGHQNLTIYYGTDDSVTIEDQYAHQQHGVGPLKVKTLKLNDATMPLNHLTFDATGSTPSVAPVTIIGHIDSETLLGSTQYDVLDGRNGDDILNGYAGHDTLMGGHGQDTLNGGTGNDYLTGEHGSDVYTFVTGDGTDVLADNGQQGIDAISFVQDASITPDTVHFSNRVGIAGDVYLSYNNDPHDRITLHKQFDNSGQGIEEIHFANGTIWHSDDIFQAAFGRASTSHQGYNPIVSSDGIDSIIGTTAGDAMIGGRGGDYLSGGQGDDLYVFNKGDGKDAIDDNSTSAHDSLTFGADITLNTISFSHRIGHKNDLVIKFNDAPSDSIMVRQFFTDNGALETFTFADGSVLTSHQVATLTDAMTGFNSVGTAMAALHQPSPSILDSMVLAPSV
jgi:Ca2+-binding RTX toxin-like protein